MAGDSEQRVLYVVVCAAPAAVGVQALVRLAQDAGWRVCVITSPMGRRFVDADRLSRMTGEPVRSDYRMPDEPNELRIARQRRLRGLSLFCAPSTGGSIGDSIGVVAEFSVCLKQVGGLWKLSSLDTGDHFGGPPVV